MNLIHKLFVHVCGVSNKEPKVRFSWHIIGWLVFLANVNIKLESGFTSIEIPTRLVFAKLPRK